MPDNQDPVATTMLSGREDPDPLVELLTTRYGMDPASATAYAQEIGAGRAAGSQAYAAQADKLSNARATERADDLKLYTELYGLRASGEKLSPQGDKFMQRMATEHRTRMNQDADRLRTDRDNKIKSGPKDLLRTLGYTEVLEDVEATEKGDAEYAERKKAYAANPAAHPAKTAQPIFLPRLPPAPKPPVASFPFADTLRYLNAMGRDN